MDDKKVLIEEELEDISGGDRWGDKKSAYLPSDHGIHIGKYAAEGYIGQMVYCVIDNYPNSYIYGVLVKSYEEKLIFGATRRVHRIRVEGASHSMKSNFELGKEYGFTGDNHTLFLYK